MAKVVLKQVSKVYGDEVTAVDRVSLEVQDKEFVVFVGPSGCGKSTTLRMVAGLEEITSGEIFIDNILINHVPAKQRDIAMVFQNYALYPHMTVYDNMAFGLKLRHYPKKEIEQRVMEAAEILGISALLNRKPKALSGGQRQRVALGRAIVRKPKVFLFDEPLSNLDAKLRVQMRTELKKLHNRLQSTMIYVTHDQVEALTMGSRIVVMKDGLVQQVASPVEVYDRPVNKFVASFIGSPPMNFFQGRLTQEHGALWFSPSGFRVRVVKDSSDKLLQYVGKEVLMGMRPEDIYDKLFAQNASPDFTMNATVEVVEPMGAEIYLHLTNGRNSFVARVNSHDTAQVNQDVEMVFDMSKAHFFDIHTEQAIQ
jgi:multiple sugar transport system ATP-binding protein